MIVSTVKTITKLSAKPLQKTATGRHLHYGIGLISGVIDVEGIPEKDILVDLYISGGEYVKTVKTDLTGFYIFQNINPSSVYDVIAYDANGVWEKKVSSRRVPVTPFNSDRSGFFFGDGAFSYASLDTLIKINDIVFDEGQEFISNFPPTSKNWRIVIMDTVALGNTNAGLTEIEMYDSPAKVNLCVGGTPTASSEFDASHAASFVFDGNKASGQWANSSNQFPCWIQYQFPEGVNVSEFSIWPRATQYIGQSPRNFRLEYLDPSNEWKVASLYMNQATWTQFTENNFSVLYGDSKPRKFWGIAIAENNVNSWSGIGELEMAQTIDGPNQCIGGTASASSVYGTANTTAELAFNGVKDVINQGWVCANNARHWQTLTYEFPSEVEVNEIRVWAFQSPDPAFTPKGAPKNFYVISSDDGISWAIEWAISDQTGWDNTPRTFRRN